MPRTFVYHVVISGFGLWLPADKRGLWTEAWEAKLGFIELHILHRGDPMRRRMAAERQSATASIEAMQSHLLVTYMERDIDNTVKWVKDQTTKAIHRETSYAGPVRCKERRRSYVWRNTRAFIECHNERRSVGPRT